MTRRIKQLAVVLVVGLALAASGCASVTGPSNTCTGTQGSGTCVNSGTQGSGT